MKKTTIKSLVLAAFMALPMLANAQTFSGIETEKANQNTPEGWTAVNLPQLPEITAANTFNIKDYGASTDAADNTKAIQKALDAVPATGGMVVIPAGTWKFGSTDEMTSTTEVLSIKSKTVLHLCAGATLKLVEYGKAPNNKTLFIGCKNKNQSDIVIEEEGETSVLDGQGARWWLAREQGKTFNPGAFIRFERGQRFLLRNFKIQNTPGVNITISNSGKASHATIHDVIISEPASEAGAGKASHNTDGISIWGPYVNIYNCNISNGDDNVVCDNDAQYIHIWNCNFGTGRGGGEEDFKFTNITMTKVKNPFSMDCYYDKKYNSDPAVDKKNARALDITTPTYNGILLQNIKTTDTSSNYAIFLVGRPESHIKNVTLDNVQIKAKRGIDIRFVDNLVFKNGSKISCTSGNLWVKNFDSTVDDQCNATGLGTSISQITTHQQKAQGIYDLSGRVIKKQATTADLASLSKGIYILNNKKYVVK